jgi:2-oxoglutarate dehydrogenase E1 component
MLLPHGYEGQGPEHSSGRLERFLQACAEDNIQVCNLTTPAQYFHVLRRQMNRAFVKPLILMTPKSLLRAEFATSREHDFTRGKFEEIFEDTNGAKSKEIKRVILCSGKVYYDLRAHRTAKKIDDAAIIRVEQLYPLAEKKLGQLIAKYPRAAKIVWCQEESQNMGAWGFIEPRLRRISGRPEIVYAGRKPSASPAVGALAVHKREQQQLIAAAFNL